ncbi:G-protein coupled receptor 54-like [Lytechinus pictus]|uniref:G-protein coupled receptor 54-like n=2 Tax=Lytechinus TaxID=7652 RepID=UPI0030B9B9CF
MMTTTPPLGVNVTFPYINDEMVSGTAGPDDEDGTPTVTLTNWLVPLLFGIITVVGVSGNAIVCYVISGHVQMRTATNYYIMNLAITDIAFLVCCAPFTAAVYATNNWIFGRFICKFVMYMMQVTAQATCMTLTAMSIDRYQAIMRPLRSLGTRTQSGVLVVSGCIWGISALIAIPIAVYFDVKQFEFGPVCYEDWPYKQYMYPAYGLFTVIFLYVIPLVIIVVCYVSMLRTLWRTALPGEEEASQSQNHRRNHKQKRRVTLMVLSVVIVFAVCWFPIYVVNLWFRFDRNFPQTNFMYGVKVFAHLLTYANSCVNPFVYSFMGRNFQRYFRKECSCCYSCRCYSRRYRQSGGRKVMTEDRAMAHFKSGHSTGNTHSTVALPLFSRSSRSSQS